MSVLLGNGDGTFQPEGTYSTSNPSAIVAGDFGRDGRLDLAVAGFVTSATGTYQATFRCCWATATGPSRARAR